MSCPKHSGVLRVQVLHLRKTSLYAKIRATQAKGLMTDGPTRFRCSRTDILHFMGTSDFSQLTVVADISVVAVQRHAPLDRACLLGCGVTTGYGGDASDFENGKREQCRHLWRGLHRLRRDSGGSCPRRRPYHYGRRQQGQITVGAAVWGE